MHLIPKTQAMDGSYEINHRIQCDYLFVYGTLMSGMNNPFAKKLRQSASCLGQAFAHGLLFDYRQEYPCAVASIIKSNKIRGELYQMTEPDPLLSDLDIYSENKGVYHIQENKKLCFLREKIVEINYSIGAHNCKPVGVTRQVKHSSKTYINKHMNWLGLEYVTEKYKKRYERIKNVDFFPQIAKHYTDDKLKVKEEFNNFFNERKVIEEIE